MKVTVKLFASLAEFLPPGATKNRSEVDLPEGITALGVMEHLKVPPDRAHLVMIDGVFVPHSERASRTLADGQEIAMFPPVAGG